MYNDSPPLQTLVLFAHLGGLLVGGGLALAADWATLRAGRGGDAERVRQLSDVDATHRPVFGGLAVAISSGLLMLLADLQTHLGSPVFWVKMCLFALLIANGSVLRSSAGSVVREPEAAWSRLRKASVASSVLWLAVLFAGTWLTGMS